MDTFGIFWIFLDEKRKKILRFLQNTKLNPRKEEKMFLFWARRAKKGLAPNL